MANCSDIVARARLPLNDSEKVRYSDVDLMAHLRAAVSMAYALRPDLRFGSYLTTPTTLELGTAFPLPVQHEQVIADYITFRAETVDDEHVNANREAKFLALFQKGILGT